MPIHPFTGRETPNDTPAVPSYTPLAIEYPGLLREEPRQRVEHPPVRDQVLLRQSWMIRAARIHIGHPGMATNGHRQAGQLHGSFEGVAVIQRSQMLLRYPAGPSPPEQYPIPQRPFQSQPFLQPQPHTLYPVPPPSRQQVFADGNSAFIFDAGPQPMLQIPFQMQQQQPPQLRLYLHQQQQQRLHIQMHPQPQRQGHRYHQHVRPYPDPYQRRLPQQIEQAVHPVANPDQLRRIEYDRANWVEPNSIGHSDRQPEPQRMAQEEEEVEMDYSDSDSSNCTEDNWDNDEEEYHGYLPRQMHHMLGRWQVEQVEQSSNGTAYAEGTTDRYATAHDSDIHMAEGADGNASANGEYPSQADHL